MCIHFEFKNTWTFKRSQSVKLCTRQLHGGTRYVYADFDRINSNSMAVDDIYRISITPGVYIRRKILFDVVL